MQLPKNKIISYSYLLLAQLMVGICIVGSKSLLTYTSAIIILSIRFIIAFVLLLTLHFIFSKNKFSILKSLTKKDWGFIFAQALCAGALFNIFLLMGLKYTSANVAGIIASVLPAIVAIFSVIFLKERLTFFTSLCIAFAVLGLIVINTNNFKMGSNSLLGDMLILIALLPEATYYILAKIHKNKLPVFLIAALMNGINIPLFLAIALLGHFTFSLQLAMTQVSLLLIVGAGSALFYVFWFLGCKDIHGAAAGLSTAFMPIATLILAEIFLKERISLLQFFGMLLVIVSIIIFNISQHLNLKKTNQAIKTNI